MAEHEKKRIMADKLYCQGFDRNGQYFSGQSMDGLLKHSCFCRTKCPVIFCVRMSWNSGSCHALWDYVLSVYVGVAQNVFFWFKAMDKGKSGAYNTSYKRGKAIS